MRAAIDIYYEDADLFIKNKISIRVTVMRGNYMKAYVMIASKPRSKTARYFLWVRVRLFTWRIRIQEFLIKLTTFNHE